MDKLTAHLHRQAAFSRATFGTGQRMDGILNHMQKEMIEVQHAENSQERLKEWIDLVILSFDGALREVAYAYPTWTFNDVAERVADEFERKQEKNELREWPDWRTADPNKAIEHVRGTHD